MALGRHPSRRGRAADRGGDHRADQRERGRAALRSRGGGRADCARSAARRAGAGRVPSGPVAVAGGVGTVRRRGRRGARVDGRPGAHAASAVAVAGGRRRPRAASRWRSARPPAGRGPRSAAAAVGATAVRRRGRPPCGAPLGAAARRPRRASRRQRRAAAPERPARSRARSPARRLRVDQRVGHLAAVGIALRRVLGQRPRDDLPQRLGHARRQRRRRVLQVAERQLDGRVGHERPRRPRPSRRGRRRRCRRRWRATPGGRGSAPAPCRRACRRSSASRRRWSPPPARRRRSPRPSPDRSSTAGCSAA